jgi:folate-dependent phosphoribosylglycinamide formyltransferase PurN
MKRIILNLLCVASGGGTDFESIAKAYVRKQLINDFFEVKVVGLISTVVGAGCLGKAPVYGVSSTVVNRGDFEKLKDFKFEMAKWYHRINPDFIFLVGCKHFVPVHEVYPTFNIHPADKEKHGGFEMVGLVPHIHVLEEIIDRLKRKKACLSDRFFTYPTIHEVPFSDVNDTEKEYDGGAEILRGQVEIPPKIIKDCYAKTITIEEAAEKLQQHVLPFEWQMLPTGVMMAARKILLDKGLLK